MEAEANAAEKAFCDQGLSEATLIEPSSRIVVGVAARMHLFLPTVPRLSASWPAGGVTVGGMPRRRRRRRPPGHSLGLGRPPGLRGGVVVDGGPAVGRLPEVLTVLALLATMATTGVAPGTAGPRCASTLRLTVGLSARGRHNLRRRKASALYYTGAWSSRGGPALSCHRRGWVILILHHCHGPAGRYYNGAVTRRGGPGASVATGAGEGALRMPLEVVGAWVGNPGSSSANSSPMHPMRWTTKNWAGCRVSP